MTKYAVFDAGGVPTGFYSPDVHGARMRPVYERPEQTEAEPDPEPILVGEVPNPDCQIPSEAIEISDEQWREFLTNQGRRKWADGSVVAYDPPVPVPTLADYSSAIDAMLDAKAQERQYDGIRTAVTYRDDPNPQFGAEGQALFEWRSIVWTYATAELAKVQAGEREQPSVAAFMTEIEAECPFAWPAA